MSTIKSGSRVSIAAASFSIYAFQELREQLSEIDELRFIFTSPSFITEKADKQRREFYIPRQLSLKLFDKGMKFCEIFCGHNRCFWLLRKISTALSVRQGGLWDVYGLDRKASIANS